jgi:hypothetical protein
LAFAGARAPWLLLLLLLLLLWHLTRRTRWHVTHQTLDFRIRPGRHVAH